MIDRTRRNENDLANKDLGLIEEKWRNEKNITHDKAVKQ